MLRKSASKRQTRIIGHVGQQDEAILQIRQKRKKHDKAVQVPKNGLQNNSTCSRTIWHRWSKITPHLPIISPIWQHQLDALIFLPDGITQKEAHLDIDH
jgi:hypothetical protein